jgi:hypothetical protein
MWSIEEVIARGQNEGILGKAQQVAAVEIALNGIPDCPILKGRRPGKGMMNIESNDPHF